MIFIKFFYFSFLLLFRTKQYTDPDDIAGAAGDSSTFGNVSLESAIMGFARFEAHSLHER